VVESALRLVSIVTAVLVLTSFALFVHDQVAGASTHQQEEIVAGAPINHGVAPPPTRHHAQPRRFIDGAAARLQSPFRAVVASSNDWVRRTVPAILAVAVYGFGLGYVARFTRGRA
jgi:hypothetical protein